MTFINQGGNAKKREQDIVPVYLNFEERLWLESLKSFLRTTKDSTALKNMAFKDFLIDKRIDVLKKRGDL